MTILKTMVSQVHAAQNAFKLLRGTRLANRKYEKETYGGEEENQCYPLSPDTELS